MVIITKGILTRFGLEHPDVAEALNSWYELVNTADWSNLTDIRQTFNSVDYVKNERYVFNIKGNQYRIVAMIFFSKRTVFIRFVGTHSEYDKIDCSTI
ncbi:MULTISPECIES: type II toxin-antitoxin system HigB family toxin [unclassified Spirosoma]|uniref:type II toxin-antitoxin system HigB family toxin n=1 Tax=unclassified Spirosoma TaxID=2621999 RepID=UPI0009608EDB|nr:MULTISPECIES: type II toxin-antitoxin system HigB family toxin [unclassified Spirosoma]MBN8824134.1 type II toxin-antitoxin system HigB family toxin [Spirosoma sp.]OJW78875.1 MAG: addiction module toxin RelE [Spirosoma sp. 48-14]